MDLEFFIVFPFDIVFKAKVLMQSYFIFIHIIKYRYSLARRGQYYWVLLYAVSEIENQSFEFVVTQFL